MRSSFTILIVLLSAAVCSAAPRLDSFYDISSVRVYSDHEKSGLWYVSPAPPFLDKLPDKSPDYGLTLYRYLGRKGTGDTGSYWARGILTFNLARSSISNLKTEILKELRKKGETPSQLKSMPVSSSRVTLMFGDQQNSRKYGLRWKSGAMVLTLEPHQAEILWDSLEAEQTLISVTIEEDLAGVRKAEKGWENSITSLTHVIAVEMDMKAYSDHFQKVDLAGRMQVGYTELDIFCFDFIEGLSEDLYAKIVEVAIPTKGRDLVETVTFRDNDEYRKRVEFKIAKDLDEPYQYRINRVLKDGSEETGPWQEKSGETMLDITAYRNIQENDSEDEFKDNQ